MQLFVQVACMTANHKYGALRVNARHPRGAVHCLGGPGLGTPGRILTFLAADFQREMLPSPKKTLLLLFPKTETNRLLLAWWELHTASRLPLRGDIQMFLLVLIHIQRPGKTDSMHSRSDSK